MRESTLNEKLLDYLNTYILKKGETLDVNIRTDGDIIDIPIIKSTKRTLRKVGVITIGTNLTEAKNTDIDFLLKSLKLTPRKKFSLKHDDPQTLTWLEQGWILNEIRLNPDGRTVASQNYRMGHRLFQHQLSLKKEQQEQLTEELNQLKNEMLEVHLEANQPMIKQQMLQHVSDKFMTVCEVNLLKESDLFPKTWTLHKRMRFLHFSLAFFRLGSSKLQMDWKEIGASYYQAIGGSKVFDRNQQEFLELLEEWSGYPAVEYGLKSLGHITPVFFSGDITGRYSSYSYGTVHAVTNVSIASEQYQTTATTLWIVENRGILTRIASQPGFLKEENVLLLCCDGHIRSAHRNFILQVLTNSHLKQAIIWTDYDKDGMVIAHDLYNILEKKIQALKWISPDGDIIKKRETYENEMNQFLQTKKMEQEERTGDVVQWKKWINN